MATNVYVDGPNLYYGALRDRPVRWLDLTTWCEQLLPDHDVKRVRYFTAWAHPSVERQQVNRQQVYLRALQTSPKISVHLGRCLKDTVVLREPRTSNQHRVVKVRLKGVDVALATQLLADAATGDCDTVVLVTNDSDFKPTIVAARRALGVRVGLVNPSDVGWAATSGRWSIFTSSRRRAATRPRCFRPRCPMPEGRSARPNGGFETDPPRRR